MCQAQFLVLGMGPSWGLQSSWGENTNQHTNEHQKHKKCSEESKGSAEMRELSGAGAPQKAGPEIQASVYVPDRKYEPREEGVISQSRSGRRES